MRADRDEVGPSLRVVVVFEADRPAIGKEVALARFLAHLSHPDIDRQSSTRATAGSPYILTGNAVAVVAGPHDLLAFATIDTNLGPNVTVFGSLATMLVLASVRRRGIHISPVQYLKIGLVTTPPMIAVASAVLLIGART